MSRGAGPADPEVAKWAETAYLNIPGLLWLYEMLLHVQCRWSVGNPGL